MPPIQEGGKLLGQGVYGCVFDPPLKCTKRKRIVPKQGQAKGQTLHSVGKITSLESGLKEQTMTEQLAKAPNADKYFVLLEEICVPEARSKQQEPDLPKCSFVKDVLLPNQAQLIMPFGGQPIRFVPRIPSRIDLYKMGQHILEAGTLLLMQKVVHRDIHPMNILVDSPTTCKLIDFGMAWRPDLITMGTNLGLQFDPAFMQEPPELTYGNGILANVPEPVIFARIFDKKRELALIQTVLGISKDAQINRLKTFLKESKSIQERNAFVFFKLYWSKFDAWAIGANLLALWTDFMYEPSFEQQPVYKFKKQTVLQVLKGLMDCDAARRFDCAEALAIWAPDSPVLQQANVKAWLKEQGAIRAKL
jgi:hypothetical protein